MKPGRSPFVVGLAGLAGAVAGAVVGGTLGWAAWTVTHPNPEGFEGLAVIVVTLLAGAVGSYPGAVLGVWLAVRGRERTRATVLWTAGLYPLLGLVPAVEVFGLRGSGSLLAIVLALGAGAAALALALSRSR